MNQATASFHDFFEMTKPRLTLLALIMATLGYSMGSEGPVSVPGLIWMLIGTALIGASSGYLNQYIEADIDAQMWRTLSRPLPSGRLTKKQVLVVGWISGILGVLVLNFAVNSVSGVLGALTLLFYLAIYTPSKKETPASTLIGAIPGALPPLIGWTAAQGTMAPMGLVLFAILFLWQIPHFLAIAWIYKEDYGRANLPILSVVDPEGLFMGRQIVLYSAALLPLSLVPSLWRVTGGLYLVGALVAGLVLFFFSALLAKSPTKKHAKWLFWASILYLPVIGLLMVWDRIT